MWRCAMWVVALPSCAFVWRIDDFKDVDAGASPDVAMDGSSGNCVAATALQDDFTFTGTCPSWAMTFGATVQDSVASGGGKLTVTKGTLGTSGCEAKSAAALTELGFFVAIEKPLAMLGAATTLSLLSSADMSGTPRWSISVGGGLIDFNVNGVPVQNIQYNATTMKFVRIHKDASGTAMVAETAPDAVAWSEFARSTAAMPPLSVYVDLAAVESSTPASADTAIWSHLNICP